METILESFMTLLPPEMSTQLAPALLILAVGLSLSWATATIVGRVVAVRVGEGSGTLFRRLVWYPAMLATLSMTISMLGFDIGLLLGAAGVLTVGIGFAAQTSAANVISGLFLLGEKPFEIDDVVRVGDTTGVVVATDLLSVKLCTFDNLLVRIPNEVLLKSKIVNLTHFQLRRIDIPLRVPNHQDIATVKDTLMSVAENNPHCLDEPSPLFIFKGFGRSGQDITFCVWVSTPEFLAVRSAVQAEIKAAFDTAGIEIPYDQLMIQGAGTGHSVAIDASTRAYQANTLDS